MGLNRIIYYTNYSFDDVFASTLLGTNMPNLIKTIQVVYSKVSLQSIYNIKGFKEAIVSSVPSQHQTF